MSVDIEELVGAYLNIRSARDLLRTKYEAEDSELKSEMLELETVLLSACNEVNANSINTSYGTVIRKVTERYSCSDWDGFKQFVLDNDAIDLYEKRIHQKNFKTYLEENPDDGLPPGVSVMREYGVSVRKSSKED
jgi:hypothetical protein